MTPYSTIEGKADFLADLSVDLPEFFVEAARGSASLHGFLVTNLPGTEQRLIHALALYASKLLKLNSLDGYDRGKRRHSKRLKTGREWVFPHSRTVKSRTAARTG